jgi:hypothetical protein
MVVAVCNFCGAVLEVPIMEEDVEEPLLEEVESVTMELLLAATAAAISC